MSTVPAVTMQELELEHAELLPRRETLWGGGSFNFFSPTQIVAGNGNHDGNGNGNNFGGINALSGNLNGNGDGNTVAIAL
jgi:hypothetical protein